MATPQRRDTAGFDPSLSAVELLECPYFMSGTESRAPNLRELWRQCEDNPGNSAAWESLLAILLPRFRRIAVRGLHFSSGNTGDTEDVIQEICLKMCQLARTRGRVPDNEAALEVYFRTLAANIVRDWLRRRQARKRDVSRTVAMEDRLALLEVELGVQGDPDTSVMMRSFDDLLDCSLRDRSVFWLYYRQGFTCVEIAAIPALGLTTKGVESLIHRTTAELRTKVK